MMLWAYLSIFVLSLGGILFLFGRHWREVKALSAEEIARALAASSSVREEFKGRYLEPVKGRFFEIYLPAFWKMLEKAVRRFRVLVLKLDTKLKYLSENLRGRHVNLEVSERSEYWKDLSGAKQENGAASDEKKPPASNT